MQEIKSMLTRILDDNYVNQLSQQVNYVCPVCNGHRYIDITHTLDYDAPVTSKKCSNCVNGLICVEVSLKKVSNSSQEAL